MAEWRMIPSPFHSAPCFEKTCAFWILSCPTSKSPSASPLFNAIFLPSSNVSWFENGEINRVATWLSWLEKRTRSVAARDPCNVDFQTFPGLRISSESFTNRIQALRPPTWDLCSLLFFIPYRFLDLCSSSFERSLWKLINDGEEFRLPLCLHRYFNNV